MKTDMEEIGTGTEKESVKENERKREKNRFEKLFCKVEGIIFLLMTSVFRLHELGACARSSLYTDSQQSIDTPMSGILQFSSSRIIKFLKEICIFCH